MPSLDSDRGTVPSRTEPIVNPMFKLEPAEFLLFGVPFATIMLFMFWAHTGRELATRETIPAALVTWHDTGANYAADVNLKIKNYSGVKLRGVMLTCEVNEDGVTKRIDTNRSTDTLWLPDGHIGLNFIYDGPRREIPEDRRCTLLFDGINLQRGEAEPPYRF